MLTTSLKNGSFFFRFSLLPRSRGRTVDAFFFMKQRSVISKSNVKERNQFVLLRKVGERMTLSLKLATALGRLFVVLFSSKSAIDFNILKVVFGSALCALEGKNPEIGEQSVLKLLDVLDNVFEIPERNTNTEPMFAVEHIYTIQGEFY